MKLDKIITTATQAARTAAVLSNNKDLPQLPAWQAKSFWLTNITVLVALANAQGVDLLSILGDMGLGGTPEAVVDTAQRGVSAVQTLVPFVTGVWAWLERRAPNFRLVFWRRRTDPAS